MKKTILMIALLLGTTVAMQAQQLAFPGAEGFGRYATGGRTGSVYHVTNLNDDGPGSFRDAVSKPNRIVVFDVAGVIRISSRISVSPNLYIAGQTAPGEGVTIYGNGLSFSGADNTICRYLRVRMGVVGQKGADAIGIAHGKNMIFDHVSAAWGRDETFSISGKHPEDITIQNSIISQGLINHSAGGLVQTENRVTIYRTLYANNNTRNPKFKGRHQYVNNIIYNWNAAAYIMGGNSQMTSYANTVGNLFITGPMGKKNAFTRANDRYHIYAQDNLLDDNQDGKLNARLIGREEYEGGPTFHETPFDYPELPTVKAKRLMDEILPTVGASLPYRDNLDHLLVQDVRSLGKQGEQIGDEANLPIGAPDTWGLWKGSNENRTDTDGDGMPDWWEKKNGTDPNRDDAMTLKDGYANIEHYINAIDRTYSQPFLKAPVALTAQPTGNQVALTWMDFTDGEKNFVVEQRINGTFQEVKRTKANATQCTISDLAPATSYTFRVKATGKQGESEYSKAVEVKTR